MNKPKAKLIGEDGNIFNLIAIASRALRKDKMEDKAMEMIGKLNKSRSYDEALSIIREYVDIV